VRQNGHYHHGTGLGDYHHGTGLGEDAEYK